MSSMAEKQALANLGPESLTCPECKSIFKEPMLLPCLQSVCRHCLSHIYPQHSSVGVIKCPQCEETIDKPENGIDGFPPNYFRNSLVSVYLAKTANHIRCRICELQGRDTFATLKCMNCGDFLCEDCGKAHTLTRMTIKHEIQPLSELSGGKRDQEIRNKQLIMCAIHDGESVKNYCENCNVPICRECQLELHVGHTCTNAKDLQLSRRKEVANM
ncbi:hypothetical protein DPMN_051840 [Dreissena polymorpha]|uniref:Uncharacterized protein n=1 Tax=Dreissena polymorpha TaxID=45954 RepID=A0A9D4CIK7_DREPO|nr:hypothetical protein DPMN_051840 [Dreissena polymorpha]